MSLSDKLKARFEKAAEQVLNQMGREGVRYLRWLAGVRVQRIKGEVIRSEPGEPPRRDKSTLWQSITYRIERSSHGSNLVFYSTDNPAKVLSLEFGNSRGLEPRPLWKHAKQKWTKGVMKRNFEERLRAKLKNMRGDPFGMMDSNESED